MAKSKSFVALALLALGWRIPAFGGPQMKGGGCVYRDCPGTATVTAIRSAPAGAYNCPREPVEVVFTFVPKNPRHASLRAEGQLLTVGAGMNPPRAFVEHLGIAVGKSYRCLRREIVSGTCTPTVYEFQALPLADFAPWCWPPSS